ncbi:hypothetical protein HU200_054572 [Digitaria exilis]|uniref:F-box domain-containing protein n=1 Tax=Digitaria exilis TaxID=1010633 RepID=A0A835E3W0_9POAL|nr:hypothetical protein HU200_054572 [Digitaria exilis]
MAAGNLAHLPVCSSDHRIRDDLPEDIFEHVLAFLPAEDAARSSLLSKRWRNAWTRARALNLSDEHHHGRRFLPFARAVLARYGSPEIPSLNVVIGRESSLGPGTVAWLRGAMERVVGSVSVTVTAPGGALDPLVLPPRLRAVSISLTLSGGGTGSKHGRLAFPSVSGAAGATSSYDALEELSLSRVQLQERVGASLSSWCPRLRKLRLRKVSGGGGPTWPLVVRMEQLEELEMDEVNSAVVEISTPRLETLIWHGGGFTKLISFLAGSQRSIRRLDGLCFYLPAKESRSFTAVRLLEVCSEANEISARIDIPEHCSPSWLSREVPKATAIAFVVLL